MVDQIRTVIIGGGISGITQAIRLKSELGDRVHITILEKKSAPGGIWRDSVWPEAGVDVPIHLYTLSNNLDPNWDHLYAFQPEVLAYWNRLIDKYDLRPLFVLNTEYVGSRWDAGRQIHVVTARNSDSGALVDIETEVLISATGPLAKRKLPNFPGIKTFSGSWFHNLDWDASVELEGKRIAVVGNGSSGVQMVPGLAKLPGTTVTHYVRSGGYFIPKLQRNYSSWEKWAFTWVPGYVRIHRFLILLEHDRAWSIKSKLNDPRRHQEARSSATTTATVSFWPYRVKLISDTLYNDSVGTCSGTDVLPPAALPSGTLSHRSKQKPGTRRVAVPACPRGWLVCGDRCANTTSDLENCGGCAGEGGVDCTTLSDGGIACIRGKCVATENGLY